MEEIVFQTYGTLLLTLLGFVLPIITIALSFFPEGVKALMENYENERRQAEKNLEEEFKKKTEKGVDYNVLSRNIADLKKSKRRANRKLIYLTPSTIVGRSVAAIGLSLCAFLASLLYIGDSRWIIPNVLLIASILSLFWTLWIFFNSMQVIVEASSAVQDIRKRAEEKTLELLTALVDNSKKGDDSLFIPQNKVHIWFAGEEVTAGKEYTFSVNNIHPIKIALKNLSDYMLKTAELGFTFPEEFLTDGSTISSTYTGDKEKIIRFKYEYVQSNENRIAGSINMTFLKIGSFKVSTFVKGENLKNKHIAFKIKVVE